MSENQRKSVEEARDQLLGLLEEAEGGQSTIITREGRPVAALVPIEVFKSIDREISLLPLKGQGRGLWGKNSVRTLRALRKNGIVRLRRLCAMV